MTIPFTGTGGLFTRIGAIGNLISDINVFQDNQLPDDTQEIVAQYPLDNDLAMIDGIEQNLQSNQTNSGSFCTTVQTYATNTVNTMVYQDNPLLSNTNLGQSLAEVIRQLKASSNTVKACTITAPVTPFGSNQGNGVCVSSIFRADGLVQENAFAENITVLCNNDSTRSASVAGHEGFAITGTVAYSAFDWRYPGGSAAQTNLTAIDATSDNSNGNLLTNSDFEAFTSNTPDHFNILVGTAGTTVFKSTSQHYDGLASLNFLGNGSELTSVAQTFGQSTTGTAGTLASQTQYACSLWLKVDSVPAAGVLEVSLVDGSNAIINDQAGNPNSFTVALTSATTSFVNHSGTFRTPYVLPSTIKIRVRLSTALTTSRNVYIDHLALGLTTTCYTGGPSVAVFSGSSLFYVPDYFTVGVTNNDGGASENRNFQRLFNRLFSMAQLGLLLPSSGSPTISDSLIS